MGCAGVCVRWVELEYEGLGFVRGVGWGRVSECMGRSVDVWMLE